MTSDAVRRLRAVDAAGAGLADDRALEPKLRGAAAALVPAWADVCVIALGELGGPLEPVAAASAGPALEPLERLLERPPAGGSVRAALADGGPRLSLDGVGQDRATAAVAAALDLQWLLVAPVPPRRRSAGCILVGQTGASGRTLDAADVELASIVARQVWMAVRLAGRLPPAPSAETAPQDPPRTLAPAAGLAAVDAAVDAGRHVLVAATDPRAAAAVRAALGPADLLLHDGLVVVTDPDPDAAGRRFDAAVEAVVAGGWPFGCAERTPGDGAASLLARAAERLRHARATL